MITIKNWRLNWALGQIFTLANYKKHSAVLSSPMMFWLALILKFYPNFYAKPIILGLKNGGQLLVREFMTLYIYSEIFVEGIYDYPDLGKGEPIIMDIGANTGLFTLRMKQLYPGASIYCYEPFPLNHQDMLTNIKLSNIQEVSVFQKGIGSISRIEKLYINKKNMGGHSLFSSEAGSEEYVNVPILALHEAFNDLKIPYFDLIKMDCEGAEYEILKSIDTELASRIGVIVFESTDSVYNLSEVSDHLVNLGFSIEFKEKSCNFIARNLKGSVATVKN